MTRRKVYFFLFTFQALATRGLVFAPATKYERILGAFALDKSKIFLRSSPRCVGLVRRAVPSQRSVRKPTKVAVNVPAKISSVLRFSQSCRTPSSTACRVHWDKIRRSNNRCYVPRENHTRGLRKQRIPTRLFAVLDAIGATCHGNKPGTRFATNVKAEWTKKQCFVRIQTISRLCYELLNRLVI